MRSPADNVPDLLDRLEWLDDPAGAAQEKIKQAVPRSSPVGEALSGTWLGHPLHPLLTDVVLGSWTSSLVLDLVGGPKAQPAADKLVAVGVLSAFPAVAAGLSDWADVSGQARRTGVLHAAGNAAALALFTASLTARRRGCRRLGVGLSLLGAAAAATAGWLGSHLTYSLGVGVNEAAFESPPEELDPDPRRCAGRGHDAPSPRLERAGPPRHVRGQDARAPRPLLPSGLLARRGHPRRRARRLRLPRQHLRARRLGAEGPRVRSTARPRRPPARRPPRSTLGPLTGAECVQAGQARRVRLTCPEIDL